MQPDTLVERALYAPGRHVDQAAEVVMPATLLCAPAGQAVQLAAAEREEYEPSAHAVHTAEVLAAAGVPYRPAAQAVHAWTARVVPVREL